MASLRGAQLRLLGAASAVLVAVAVALAVANAIPPPRLNARASPTPSPTAESSSSTVLLRPSPSPALPSPTPAAPQAADARVVQILDSMHQHAFNPDAPPTKSSTTQGGLFINWDGYWDGNLATASKNTNFDTGGQTDSETGANPRHDPVTDLYYLRNLWGYKTSHNGSTRYDADIARVEPVVKAEFGSYTYYRASIYFEFIDLDRFEPGQGWDTLARSYASAMYTNYFKRSRGAIIDSSHSTYRSDFAAEAAAALVDAGNRHSHSEWIQAGEVATSYLITHAADPGTGLFPLEMSVETSSDIVKQKQIKIGEMAQLLDSLLVVYDVSHDASILAAVRRAVESMYSPQLGLHDRNYGGFFFSVNADGTQFRGGTTYKETRQAWMLKLMGHLNRIDGSTYGSRLQEALTTAMDDMWQASLHGYVYRLNPDFTLHVNFSGPYRSAVIEHFVTSEAMGIVCQVLEEYQSR